MNLPAKVTLPHPPGSDANVPLDVVSIPKMHRLLDQAAQLAARAGLPPDAFVGIAWQACLRGYPGLAEHMAEAHFDAALDGLRRSGRLAKA